MPSQSISAILISFVLGLGCGGMHVPKTVPDKAIDCTSPDYTQSRIQPVHVLRSLAADHYVQFYAELVKIFGETAAACELGRDVYILSHYRDNPYVAAIVEECPECAVRGAELIKSYHYNYNNTERQK